MTMLWQYPNLVWCFVDGGEIQLTNSGKLSYPFPKGLLDCFRSVSVQSSFLCAVNSLRLLLLLLLLLGCRLGGDGLVAEVSHLAIYPRVRTEAAERSISSSTCLSLCAEQKLIASPPNRDLDPGMCVLLSHQALWEAEIQAIFHDLVPERFHASLLRNRGSVGFTAVCLSPPPPPRCVRHVSHPRCLISWFL